MSRKCPLCGASSGELVQNTVKGGVETDVLRCSPCELDYLETWDNVEHVKSLYEADKYVFTANVSEESEIPIKFNEYDERYKWMKPYLSPDQSLLEIGCGDGTFLRMIQDDVALAEGVELSPPQVKRLREEGYTCYDTMIDEMEPQYEYDIVCMFALLEHVPLVCRFLEHLKKYIHEKSNVFIEVPNLHDVLISGYDVTEYRDFYYRQEHLYYFTPKSLGLLLNRAGFHYETHTNQQASITNHFHWMHNRCGQATSNHMTAVVTPVSTFGNLTIKNILEEVDDYYRKRLLENNLGDLLSARAWLKNANV